MNYLDGLTKGGVDYELRDARIVPDLDNVDNIIYSNFETEEIANKAIASFDDGADTVPVKELKVGIESTQDLHGQASPYPENGGKNKLAITATTQTLNGVTFTILKDSANNIIGINANGTATASVILNIGSKANLIEGTSYILSGCPSGGGSSTYRLAIAAPYWTYDDGAGVTFTNSGTTTEVRLQITNGVTVNNLVFKPMIRLASETDTTFAPYSNICPIVTNAEKNLLQNRHAVNTVTSKGVTLTTNEDGTVTASGTATGDVTLFLVGSAWNYESTVKNLLPAGDYLLSGGFNSRQRIEMCCYKPDGSLYINGLVAGANKSKFTIESDAATDLGYLIYIRIQSGDTADFTFKPMIRDAANPDPTFVPYRGVVRVDVKGKNLLDSSIWELGSISAAGNNTASNDSMRTRIDSLIPVEPNTTYTFSENETSSEIWVTEYSGDTITVPRRKVVNNSRRGTFTTGENTTFIRLRVNCATTGVLNTETQLELGSTATDYEPYKDRTYFSLAKNVWDEEWELGQYNPENGEPITNTTNWRSKNISEVAPSISYYFKDAGVYPRVFEYDANKAFIRSYLVSANIFTTSENAHYINFHIGGSHVDGIAILTAPPEIYGGELNVTTGELKVTLSMRTFKGTETWGTSSKRAYTGKPTEWAGENGQNTNPLVISDQAAKLYDDRYGAYFSITDSYLYVNLLSADDTKAALQSRLAANNLHVLGALATPQIFQLDPVEVKTWLAKNNITANTGDIIKLDYRVSPQITKNREQTELNQKILAVYPQDTASGFIASFPDGAENVPVKELTADIEPIQDLHGQASPWPGGANANKLDPSTVTNRNNATISNGVVTQQVADGAINVVFKAISARQDFSNVEQYGTTYVTSTGVVTQYFNITSETYYVVFGLNGAQRDTTVYADIHNLGLPDGRYYIQVNFTNITQGSISWKDMMLCDSNTQPYVPYSNICPISGYTGAEITRTGKNLFNGAYEVAYLENGITWKTNNTNARTAVVPVKGGVTYTANKNGGNRFVICETSELPVVGTPYTQLFSDPAATTATVTPSASANYLLIYVTLDNTEPQMQVEPGSTDSPYEDFNGTVYSIDWTDEAGTVYKGTAEYKGNGEWEITPTYGAVDLGAINWNKAETSGGVKYFRANINTKKNGVDNLICSCYQQGMGTIAESPDMSIAGRDYEDVIVVVDSLKAELSAADYKTAVTGQTLVYELSTPTSFIVDGPDPETLLGDNNMWSNTGDVSVKYRANVALYVDKKISEI